ncbi:O-antigen ligase family protein [Patescibacteria group bacterium]|nr:O-antigen ligase family protein [Patescibacteria group bacterium]
MITSENLNKILRWGVYVSLFLPLVVFSQHLSPFHFGKMILFRSLVELMAVFYILLIIIDKRYRPKWNLILISFTAYTGLYIFTGLIGVNFFSSMWGSIERMGGIFSFIHFWVYFVILISIIRIKLDWNKILKITTFVGFLSILFAYGQRLRLGSFFVGWQHGERVIGTIGNPALFAGYLLFILYLALWFLLKKQTDIREKGFYSIVLILGIPVLLMTAVRGAILSFFITIILLALFFVFASKNKKLKISLIIAILIFVLFFTFAFIGKNSTWVKNISWLDRITSLSLDSDTLQTRIWSWTSAIEGWKERPIFGWGPENFSVLHMKHFDARHFTHVGSETIWDRAHNVPLNALSTMGAVGLLSYLSIFVSMFIVLIKKFKSKRIGKITFGVFSAMIIAYFIQNLFIFDTFVNYFLFFMVLAYVYYLKTNNKKIEPLREKKYPSTFLIVILLILAVILIFQTNIRSSQANFSTTRAILAGRAGNAQKAVDKYQEALNCKRENNEFICNPVPEGAYEIRHKLATFAIQLAETMKQKQGDFDPSLLYFSIKIVSKNIERFPLDTVPYLYVGRMYILLIEKDGQEAANQALASINKALELNKRNPRIWYELGQAQMSIKEYEESYNSFKTAAELNPEVSLSWWFTAVSASAADKNEEALEALNKALELGWKDFETNTTELLRMVKIFEKAQRYDMVARLYELGVQQEPESAQMYASLAAAYAHMGQFDKARQAADKAVQIDPNFKEEYDKFINSLYIVD